MARKTRKYNAAMDCVRKNKIVMGLHDHETMYRNLNNLNFFWNPTQGEWEHKDYAPSTSVFEADDGTATGIVKIRVMAHPKDLAKAISALKQATGMRVIEISEKSYPNRKGTGERIYTTAILDGEA